MNDTEYRQLARRTRIKRDAEGHEIIRSIGVRLAHWTTGLCGESGEIANDVKKTVFTEKFTLDQLRDKVKDEAGDVLWYLDALLDELGITLDEVKEFNIQKLAIRHNVRQPEPMVVS